MARISADTRQLKTFAKKVKAGDPKIQKALRSANRKAGNLIRDDARANASWSTTIPKTVRTSANGTSVTVKAGGTGPKPFLAKWWETGKTDKGKKWRHPGRDGVKGSWYDEGSVHGPPAPRPFLEPAADANRDKVKQLVNDAMHDAVAEIVRGDG